MVGAPVSKCVSGVEFVEWTNRQRSNWGISPNFFAKKFAFQYMERTSELGVLRWFARNCESTQDLSEGDKFVCFWIENPVVGGIS